jgi:hypothetical protein
LTRGTRQERRRSLVEQAVIALRAFGLSESQIGEVLRGDDGQPYGRARVSGILRGEQEARDRKDPR